jgi:hypothetical protein
LKSQPDESNHATAAAPMNQSATAKKSRKEAEAKWSQGRPKGPVSFAGKTEVIWLLFIGIVSGVAFIVSLAEGASIAVDRATGLVAGVFPLPFALIVIAVILSGIFQIFTPRGGSAIPLFGWRGGVDGLSSEERMEFESKPRIARFAKVYLWLAVNSLVGAAIALIAFAGLYVMMRFAQQQHPN